MERVPDSCRFAIDSGDQAAAASGPATASTTPYETGPRIAELRELHAAMARAGVRDEVLARLLALNAARAGRRRPLGTRQIAPCRRRRHSRQ